MCDSSDSGSSDSGCSANFDSPSSPMSDSGSICGPLSHPGMGDLMPYGMSIERLTADSRSGEINRRRIASDDFFIRRGAFHHEARKRRDEDSEIARKRYGGNPASKLPETNVEPPHLCAADPKEWEAEIARVGAEAHAAMDDLCYRPGGPAWAKDEKFTPPCREVNWSFWGGYVYGVGSVILVWIAWGLS